MNRRAENRTENQRSCVRANEDRYAGYHHINSTRHSAKNKILLLVISFSIVLTLALVGSSVAAAGKSSASDQNALAKKYYTSILIQDGDSLWSIAEQYRSEEYSSLQDYIHEVVEINGLTSETIYSGQYLTIPYYES